MKHSSTIAPGAVCALLLGTQCLAETVTQQPSAPIAEIHLACHGVASFTDTRGGSSLVFTSQGQSASGVASLGQRGVSEDDVFFDLLAGDARIKIPGVLVPPVHTDDDHGWRPINDLQVGETEITGRFDVNFINKPTVSINRVTGHIDLRGFARMGFSGDCKPYDPTARMF